MGYRSKSSPEPTNEGPSATPLAWIKTDFFASICHELQTPLSGIVGLVELLLNESSPAQQRDCANAALASAQHLQTLVTEILEFAEVSARRPIPMRRSFKFEDVLASVSDAFSARSKRKGGTLNLYSQVDHFALFQGDRSLVQRVLFIMIDNALKFDATGEIDVNITKPSGVDGAGSVLFEVRDHGQGLSDAAQAHLFQPFELGDPSGSRKFSGLGLGLALAKLLVDAMDGAIGMDPAAGGGSRFWFTVPLPLVQSPAIPVALPGECPDRPRSILIVDDNPINLKIAQAMVHRLGYSTTLAANGRKAVAAASAAHYDVILMDCQMPEMDGYQATVAIRALPNVRAARTVIIALTTQSFLDQRASCLAAGMDDFVSKPTSTEALSAIFKRWLGPT